MNHSIDLRRVMNLGPAALVATSLVIGATAFAAPFRYAEDRAPGIVNPLFGTTMSESRVHELVFEGLYTDDLDLRSAPALAESAEPSADKKSLTVKLRSGVTWHDGTAFTAKDVVFTVDAMKNAETASTEGARVAFISGATASDDHTVVLTFQTPEAAPQDKLHFKILPAHKFPSTAVKRNDAFRSNPIGTGPFVVENFNDDNSVTLKKNPSWWGKAQIDELLLREVADKNYQAKLLIYESLEALVRVLPRDLAALQNDRKVELYPYQTNSWWYVGFNTQQGTWKDPLVREAIANLVDVDELLRPIGTGDLISGPFVKSSPYYNHEVEVRKKDPARAQALLEEAGWQLIGRQWMKDGRPLQIRLATLSDVETAQDVVINLQSQLQNHGIAVEPAFLGQAEWKEKVWRDRNFDVILSQWSFDRNEDVYQQLHSKGNRNFGGYANTEVDQRLDKARLSTDPQEKKALLREVHAIVAKDNPMLFLFTLDSYAAMSVKVKNVVVHPFYFFTWADRWSMN
jgi:peptide/nickel transport system substrate-binding protein